MEFYTQPIFTLNARGNILFEVTRDYFNLTDKHMHNEIQKMHTVVQQILATKKISYDKLKYALVPKTDRHEAGFIFDSQSLDSWYGYEVAKIMLPLYNKDMTQSVLWGDLIGENQDMIFKLLDRSLVLSRPFKFTHGSSLYCVYINNLTKFSIKNFHQSLSKFPAYVGYIPSTFSSPTKTYLSAILCNAFIKYGNKIIMGHEDDRSNNENVNMIGYPFEDFGYNVLSFQSVYFDTFLSYKIERAVFPGFKVDTEMSLAAVAEQVIPLKDCEVQIDEAKHNYLKSEKLGKLKKAGIASLDRAELANIIKMKIEESYIYNLTYLSEHDTIKFNLIVEIQRRSNEQPIKLLAILHYKPQEKILKLITLY